jgi:predicted Holliday junction resolvase-like endonuclease
MSAAQSRVRLVNAAAVLAGFLVLVAVIAVLAVKLHGAVQASDRIRHEAAEREPGIRADAVKRSRTAHMASISEKLAAHMPDFPYNPKDVQWTGGPGGVVDYIVYDGLEVGGPVTIVLLDVKTGMSAKLTANQRLVRDAADGRRVKFDVYRMPGLADESEEVPELAAELAELPELAQLPELLPEPGPEMGA